MTGISIRVGLEFGIVTLGEELAKAVGAGLGEGVAFAILGLDYYVVAD